MTSKERVQAAMRLQKPDRVPVMCQLSFGHILLNTGIRPSEFIFNPVYFAEGLWQSMKRYNFDGVMINQWCNQPEEFRKSLKIERREDGEMCHLPNGNSIFCPYNDTPRFYYQNPKPYPEIDAISVSKIERELRTSWTIPDWKVEAHRIILKKANNIYSVHGEVVSPLDSMIELLGIENSLLGFLLDPEKCKAILDLYVERNYQYAEAQIAAGVDAMKISSPFAGAGFISSDHYREFVAPYERKLVRKIHDYIPGLPIYTHTCGKIGDRLELMADTGIDGIECLDPIPLGDCELADAKSRIGAKLFIKGNMDSVNELLDTNEARIEQYVKRQIADGAPGGGYILSSACSVAPRVKPEIMKLLVPLAEKYGRY